MRKHDPFFAVLVLFLMYSLTSNAQKPAKSTCAPDLVISEFTVYDGIGPDVDYNMTIENQGVAATAGVFTVRVYLSADTEFTDGDHRIDQFVYSQSFEVGQSHTPDIDDLTVTGVPTGSYYMGAIIDVFNQVDELDEENNETYDASIMCAIIGYPDLIVSRLELAPVDGTDKYTYNFEVYNQGGEGATGSVKVHAVLSTDTNISSSDFLLDEYTVPENMFATYYWYQYNIEIDPSTLSLAPGDYYLGMIVDVTDIVAEEDETNNTRYVSDPQVNIATDIPDEPSQLPERYELLQNYPNPFNAGTLLMVRLPSDSDIELVIFDIRGQVVNRLYKGRKTSGEHTILWNGQDQAGRDVSSGIYFCRLIGGEIQQTVRMLLIR